MSTLAPPRRHAAERQPPDEELFLRFREQGDNEALEDLIHRYEGELFGYLRRYVNNPELADEVFQQTFVQLYRKQDQYEAGRPLRPWLYRIATHLALDALRRIRRDKMVSLDAEQTDDDAHSGSLLDLLQANVPAPSARLEDEERRAWLRETVDRLPDGMRAVVLLVFFQGLSYAEAAHALDIPLGTVKSRLHAALGKLHAAWESRVAAEERTDGR